MSKKPDPQDLHLMLSKIGVKKSAVEELRKQSNIISKLSEVINEAGVSRCPYSVGTLIYEVAKSFPENASAHRPKLLKYVTESKITNMCQLVASFNFLLKSSSKVFDVSRFETACGVGLTNAQASEMTKKAVHEKCDVNKERFRTQSFDKNYKEVYAHVTEMFPWADPEIFTDHIHTEIRRCSKQMDAVRSSKNDKEEQHLSSDRSAADYKTAAQKIEEEPRKVQVHVKRLNVPKSSANILKFFRKNIQEKIAISREAPRGKVFFLPSRKDARNDPYFLFRMCADSYEITFIYQRSSLYAKGYITSEEKKVYIFASKKEVAPNLKCKKKVQKDEGRAEDEEEDDDDEDDEEDEEVISAMLRRTPGLKTVDMELEKIEFPVSYTELQNLAGKNRTQIELGQKQLEDAIYKFCKSDTPKPELAKAMIVIIQMFSEFWRFTEMEKFICMNYKIGKPPGAELADLQTNWGQMSKKLIKWIRNEESLDVDIEEIANAISIAKNRKGKW